MYYILTLPEAGKEVTESHSETGQQNDDNETVHETDEDAKMNVKTNILWMFY